MSSMNEPRTDAQGLPVLFSGGLGPNGPTGSYKYAQGHPKFGQQFDPADDPRNRPPSPMGNRMQIMSSGPLMNYSPGRGIGGLRGQFQQLQQRRQPQQIEQPLFGPNERFRPAVLKHDNALRQQQMQRPLPYGGGPGYAIPQSPPPSAPNNPSSAGGAPTSWKMSIEPMAGGGMIQGYQNGGMIPGYQNGGQALVPYEANTAGHTPMVYSNGGWVPAYANGGEIPGYFLGGKWGTKFKNLVKKAAPVVLGAINPALGAGIGALISGIENKSLKSALAGGMKGYLGGKALSAGLKGAGLAGGKGESLMGGIRSIVRGKGLSQGAGKAYDYLSDPRKIASVYPLLAELEAQQAQENPDPETQMPSAYTAQSQAIMPQSSTPGYVAPAQGYASLPGGGTPSQQTGALGPLPRAEGGLMSLPLPGYQSGGSFQERHPGLTYSQSGGWWKDGKQVEHSKLPKEVLSLYQDPNQGKGWGTERPGGRGAYSKKKPAAKFLKGYEQHKQRAIVNARNYQREQANYKRTGEWKRDHMGKVKEGGFYPSPEVFDARFRKGLSQEQIDDRLKTAQFAVADERTKVAMTREWEDNKDLTGTTQGRIDSFLSENFGTPIPDRAPNKEQVARARQREDEDFDRMAVPYSERNTGPEPSAEQIRANVQGAYRSDRSYQEALNSARGRIKQVLDPGFARKHRENIRGGVAGPGYKNAAEQREALEAQYGDLDKFLANTTTEATVTGPGGVDLHDGRGPIPIREAYPHLFTPDGRRIAGLTKEEQAKYTKTGEPVSPTDAPGPFDPTDVPGPNVYPPSPFDPIDGDPGSGRAPATGIDAGGPGGHWKPKARPRVMPKSQTRFNTKTNASPTPAFSSDPTYRAGLMAETASETGNAPMVGHNPFNMPTAGQASQFGPAYGGLMGRLGGQEELGAGPAPQMQPQMQPPMPSGTPMRADGGPIDPSMMQPGGEEMPPEIEQVAIMALKGQMPPAQAAELLDEIRKLFPAQIDELTNQIRVMAASEGGAAGLVSEGYLPPYPDNGLQGNGEVDDMVAIGPMPTSGYQAGGSTKDFEKAFQERVAGGGPLPVRALLAGGEYIVNAGDAEAGRQELIDAATGIDPRLSPGAAVWDDFVGNING